MKGGISETRIEKRIVISGDADIDHDEVRFKESLAAPLACRPTSAYLYVPPNIYCMLQRCY